MFNRQYSFLIMFFFPLIVGVISGLITNLFWNLPIKALEVAGVTFAICFVSFIFLQKSGEQKILGKMKIYSNFSRAVKDIAQSAKGSSLINIVAIRGAHILEGDSSVYTEISKGFLYTNTRVRILLLNPESTSMQRYLNETVPKAKIAEYIGRGNLLTEKLTDQSNRGVDVKVQYYDDAPLWKLLMTNRHCFFIGYIDERRGHSLPLIRVENSNNCFAIALTRYFEDLWNKSAPKVE